MSAEVYMACEDCKAAFHIGYIVTMRSNFVFNKDFAERLLALQAWIDKHSYCGPEGAAIRYPRLAWEPTVEEDSWSITR